MTSFGPSPSGRGAGECPQGRGPGPGKGRGEGDSPSQKKNSGPLSRRSNSLIVLSAALLLAFLGLSESNAANAQSPPPARIRTHAEHAPPANLPLNLLPNAAKEERLHTGRMERPGSPAPATLAANRGGQKPPPRVVVFVLDRVSLGDLFAARAPHLQGFFRQNAVGLMNFASVATRTVEGSYASIGAGMHAAALDEAGLSRNARETIEGGTAHDVFLRRTGMRVGPGTVVNLGLAQLLRYNEDRHTGATVGALGSLASQGGPTAVIGNSDAPMPGLPVVRFAPLIAMRPSGIVDRGDTSPDLLRPDPAAPFGIRTDPDKLEAAFRRYAPGTSLTVVDLGETTRADDYRKLLAESVLTRHRLMALARADALFARLLDDIDPSRTRVLVLTPYPPQPKEGPATQLAPLAVSHADSALLSSGTTQGAGLVANIDVAPGIAQMLWDASVSSGNTGVGANPGGAVEMTGSPFEFTPRSETLPFLVKLDAAVTAQRLAASGGFLIAVALLEVLFGGIALSLALRNGSRSWLRKAACRFCLCAVVTMPLALVAAGEQMPGTLSTLVLFVALFWAGLSLVFLPLGGRAVPGALLATGLALLADLYAGGWGLRLSPISDFPIVGVRFHGLANEYMGVAVGALLMGACGLLDLLPPLNSRPGRVFLVVLFATAAVTVGMPTLGDDAGGLIAATLGFGAAGLLMYGLPLKARNLIGLLALAFCAMWILTALDMTQVGPSHYGRSILIAREAGPGYLWDLVSRKIALNFRILADFRAVVTVMGAVALAYLALSRYRDRLRAVLSRRPGLALGLRAAVVGAVAAWAFNDTGILPAVFILAGGLVALLAALLEDTGRPPAPALIQIDL